MLKIRTLSEIDKKLIDYDIITLYKAEGEGIGLMAYASAYNLKDGAEDYWFFTDYVPESIFDVMYNEPDFFTLAQSAEDVELDGHVLKTGFEFY